jgi:hypothetical protein
MCWGGCRRTPANSRGLAWRGKGSGRRPGCLPASQHPRAPAPDGRAAGRHTIGVIAGLIPVSCYSAGKPSRDGRSRRTARGRSQIAAGRGAGRRSRTHLDPCGRRAAYRAAAANAASPDRRWRNGGGFLGRPWCVLRGGYAIFGGCWMVPETFHRLGWITRQSNSRGGC